MELLPTITWNTCLSSRGIGAHDPVEHIHELHPSMLSSRSLERRLQDPVRHEEGEGIARPARERRVNQDEEERARAPMITCACASEPFRNRLIYNIKQNYFSIYIILQSDISTFSTNFDINFS